MLQMDIEGFEDETILSASSDLLRRVRILIIEFHSVDELWCESSFTVASGHLRICCNAMPAFLSIQPPAVVLVNTTGLCCPESRNSPSCAAIAVLQAAMFKSCSIRST